MYWFRELDKNEEFFTLSQIFKDSVNHLILKVSKITRYYSDQAIGFKTGKTVSDTKTPLMLCGET